MKFSLHMGDFVGDFVMIMFKCSVLFSQMMEFFFAMLILFMDMVVLFLPFVTLRFPVVAFLLALVEVVLEFLDLMLGVLLVFVEDVSGGVMFLFFVFEFVVVHLALLFVGVAFFSEMVEIVIVLLDSDGHLVNVHSHSRFFLDGVFPFLDHSLLSFVIDVSLVFEELDSFTELLDSVHIKFVHFLHVVNHGRYDMFVGLIVTERKRNRGNCGCVAGRVMGVSVMGLYVVGASTSSMMLKRIELFHFFLGSVISKLCGFFHLVHVLLKGELLVLNLFLECMVQVFKMMDL
jgi:hypothetical protein